MTKSPHFFKAYSRIGLTYKPVRQSGLNLGVESGPDAILDQNFISGFPDTQVDQFIFPNPEDIRKKDYWQVLASNLNQFKNQINKKLKKNQMQIVAGGENSVTFASLLAILNRIGDSKKIGYVQIDSHGEMNSYKGSESKNFHGMYMRPFFETFDIPEIAKLVPFRLAPSQAFFIGDTVLDGDEPEFFKKMGFKSLTFEKYISNPQNYENLLKNFCHDFEYIHVNFDIDVFDKSVAGATGIPEDGKWMLKEIMTLLGILKKHPKLSFDLSEVNPKKAHAVRTITIARKLLKYVIL